jgi:hypothetical protein
MKPDTKIAVERANTPIPITTTVLPRNWPDVVMGYMPPYIKIGLTT